MYWIWFETFLRNEFSFSLFFVSLSLSLSLPPSLSLSLAFVLLIKTTPFRSKSKSKNFMCNEVNKENNIFISILIKVWVNVLIIDSEQKENRFFGNQMNYFWWQSWKWIISFAFYLWKPTNYFQNPKNKSFDTQNKKIWK